MIYLRKFDNHAAYEAAESSLILPNVSLCVQENEVHYKPLTPPTPTAETRVVAIFNVEYTDDPIQILGVDTNISSIEIDGTELPSVVSEYEFSTTGEHTVKYTLIDPTTISGDTFIDCYRLASIYIPDSITSVSDLFSAVYPSSCVIGSGITTINGCLYWNAYPISLTIKATTPPTFEGGYLGCGEFECPTIYVPSESVDIYKQAEVWSSYSEHIVAIP